MLNGKAGAERVVADGEIVCAMQGEEGVITTVEKPYTDELICWHYDHAQGQLVKGINFITALYTDR